jgi:hypothetical protein
MTSPWRFLIPGVGAKPPPESPSASGGVHRSHQGDSKANQMNNSSVRIRFSRRQLAIVANGLRELLGYDYEEGDLLQDEITAMYVRTCSTLGVAPGEHIDISSSSSQSTC